MNSDQYYNYGDIYGSQMMGNNAFDTRCIPPQQFNAFFTGTSYNPFSGNTYNKIPQNPVIDLNAGNFISNPPFAYLLQSHDMQLNTQGNNGMYNPSLCSGSINTTVPMPDAKGIPFGYQTFNKFHSSMSENTINDHSQGPYGMNSKIQDLSELYSPNSEEDTHGDNENVIQMYNGPSAAEMAKIEIVPSGQNKAPKTSSSKLKKGCMRKEAHNIIERRYRTQINRCFTDLETATFNVDLKEVGTHTKSVILRTATEKIRLLAADNAKLHHENELLKGRLTSNSPSVKSSSSTSKSTPVPYFLKGNNSSKNVIVLAFMTVSLLLFSLGQQIDLEGWKIYQINYYTTFFLIIGGLCWIYLNWHGFFLDKDPITNYQDSIAKYYESVKKGNFVESSSHLISAFCAIGFGIPKSWIDVYLSYTFYFPTISLYFNFPFIWNLIIKLFGKLDTYISPDFDYNRACQLMIKYINTLSMDSCEKKSSFDLLMYKCLYFAIANRANISSKNFNDLVLLISFSFTKSHPKLTITLLHAVTNCSSHSEENFVWSNSKKIQDILIRDGYGVLTGDIRPLFASPHLDNECFICCFSVHAAEVLFFECISPLWDQKEQSQEKSQKLLHVNILVQQMKSILLYQKLTIYEKQYIVELIRLVIYYVCYTYQLSLPYMEECAELDFNENLYVMLIKLCIDVLHIKLTKEGVEKLSEARDNLSFFIQSEPAFVDPTHKVGETLICLATYVLVTSGDVSDDQSEIREFEQISGVGDHFMFVSASSKFSCLKQQAQKCLYKNLRNFECNPLLMHQLMAY